MTQFGAFLRGRAAWIIFVANLFVAEAAEKTPLQITEKTMSERLRQETFQLPVRGRNLEVLRIRAGDRGAAELVFLHEGLGSVSHWRDFPALVAERTRCPVTVYSRYGSGYSDVLDAPQSVRYMHDEALLVLPELLSKLEIENPVLVGHSDGGSIAIIHAGEHDRVRGLVLMAPHVFVEDLSVASIRDAKVTFETTDLGLLLGRHHRDAAKTFWGWNDIWLDPAFRSWNIEEYVPKITCPVLCIQGEEDEYGTIAQVEAIKAGAQQTQIAMLPNCKHSPHRDQAEKTLELVAELARTVGS